MLIKTTKGMYKVERNFRDAFNATLFQERYLEEYFDKYKYIVGDFSAGILRLKGFDTNPKSDNFFHKIDRYLDDSCAFGCPFFVLSRIYNENEYNRLLEKDNNNSILRDSHRCEIKPIEKENFDKESLILETSRKNRPHIVLDNINKMPEVHLSEDMIQIIKQDKESMQVQPKKSNNGNQVVPKQPEVEVQTYVSASPDFDPSKKEKNTKRFNKNGRRHGKR